MVSNYQVTKLIQLLKFNHEVGRKKSFFFSSALIAEGEVVYFHLSLN